MTTKFSTLRLLALCLLVPILSFSQDKAVGIRIVQEQGTFLYDFETHLLLRKKAFKVQVLLENMKGVYVFASIRDSVYRFNETDSIRDFIYLPMLELKEDRYNTEKELNISEVGWSNWYYDPAGIHPFHQKIFALDGNRIVCTKFVKQLYDVSEGRQIRMKEIRSPLYLFFIAVSEYDKDGKPLKELLRRKVKIEWLNEDDED